MQSSVEAAAKAAPLDAEASTLNSEAKALHLKRRRADKKRAGH